MSQSRGTGGGGSTSAVATANQYPFESQLESIIIKNLDGYDTHAQTDKEVANTIVLQFCSWLYNQGFTPNVFMTGKNPGQSTF